MYFSSLLHHLFFQSDYNKKEIQAYKQYRNQKRG
ncbi:hypothetical protein AALP_AAs52007U000600 [Arabis alpina]|uniref:Uncharacterized protein n=1 Tax=Arabis alpina TaxID=50452 RepID=A0A087G2D3_ARAAL|nr:hypothetical protein AALP_AAs52007U000600 [Arabis alpina]